MHFRFYLISSWLLGIVTVLVQSKFSSFAKSVISSDSSMPFLVVAVILVLHAGVSLACGFWRSLTVYSHLLCVLLGCYSTIIVYWLAVLWKISGTIVAVP